MTEHGTVAAAYGRQYEVRLEQGETLLCFPRGKKSLLAVGDRVSLERTAPGQGVVTATAPRHSLLYRSDPYRQKLIAANVTQVVLVVATEPGYSGELLSRCLVAAEQQGLASLILLNKADLADKLTMARQPLHAFIQAGYPVLELAALQGTGLKALLERLHGQRSVLVGQSGMGKSTLINALIPEAEAQTREISAVLDSGKHTTTFSRLYSLDGDSQIIDCPGVQEFGLAHLERSDMEQGFPEFRPYLGHCRFRDCRHDREPDCALRAGLADGQISAERYAHFQRMVREFSRP